VDGDGVVLTWTLPEEVVLLALGLDGRECWRRNLGPYVTLQGSGISPIIVGDMVVLDNSQEDPNLLPGSEGRPSVPVGKSSWIAVDRKTGATRWQVDRPTSYSSYGTPCVLQSLDGRMELVFTSTSRGIDQKFLDRTIASPVIAPGLILAGCGEGLRASRLVAVRPGEEGRKPTVVYELSKALPLVPTPLVKDGRLYLWGDDGVVSCLRVADGEQVWCERVQGSFYGSPVWVDHKLYCIARSGEVVVIADGDKFESLARVPLGEQSYATPAVAGGVMYLRTRSQLYSLGGRASH
jgi:outer membrane protein assembly factor BamB